MHTDRKNKIKILEIGVDTGISLFALVNNLNMLQTPFSYVGVDVKIQNHVDLMKYMFFQAKPENSVNLIEQNSLSYLPTLNEKFDIILLDGDHNYETVSQECNYLSKLMHEDTIVVVDDYDGRWAYKDLYYSEREDYKENTLVTKKINQSEQQGVKPAIDEFIEKNEDIISVKFMQGEPIVLLNKKNKYVVIPRGEND